MYKKALAITAVAALVVAVGAAAWFFLVDAPEGYYYTQIDNSKTKALDSKGGVIDPTGGMSLSYALAAYDKDGSERQIEFGTERELREGAYLRLSVVPVRGVVEWMEVDYDDIPAKAQERLPREG